ncbi:MAG TPA: mechanosensitive ion channel family protein [Halobacteria archaeon]|jgi:small-conductance mechanosensitive channel|nr:mechanosensitive ion channel family protein [Halobacteria archaeon]
MSRRIKVDETRYTLLRRLTIVLIYFIGCIVIINMVPQLNMAAKSLLAASGIVGIIIGLAAQTTISNVISGISIAISQPFRVGDRIEVDDIYGTVEDITLRHTVIRTWQNKRVVIPNSIIGDKTINNWSLKDPNVAWYVDFSISYDSDIDLAKSIILEEMKKNENILLDRDINVKFIDIKDFSAVLRASFWVPDRGFTWDTSCMLRDGVKRRFDEAGIEISTPYRTLLFKGDLETKKDKTKED